MQESRNINLDLLKVISIFGVVFIHSAGMLGGNVEVQKFFSQIFRVAVPCFIIIWVFFFDSSYSKKSGKDKLKYQFSRFKHLFIVYSLWSLLYLFITIDLEHITIVEIFTKHFLGYGWSGQYYFLILFQLIVFYKPVNYLYKYKKVMTIIIFFIFITIFYYNYNSLYVPSFAYKIGDKLFIYWLPYVFFGFWLREKNFILSQSKVLWGVLLLPILIPLEFLIFGDEFWKSPYLIYSVFISSLGLATLFFFKKFSIKNQFIQRIISYIGSNTMTIFVANPLFIIIFYKYFYFLHLDGDMIFNCMLPFLSTLLVIFMCLILEKVIKLLRLNGIAN